MKKKIAKYFFIFINLFAFASCDEKEENPLFDVSKTIDRFELEKVQENDFDKIRLYDDVYYKIAGNDVVFYNKNEIINKKINTAILNDEIYFSNDNYYCLTYNEGYCIFNFVTEEYTRLEYTLNDYDNMYLYAIDQELYLLGNVSGKTDIMKILTDFNVTKLFSADLDTSSGIYFLYLWDEYFVIQNSNYEYFSNCNDNLTRVKVTNRLDVINDETYFVKHFYFEGSEYGYYNGRDTFFKKTLFYKDDSFEKEYYDYYHNLAGDSDYSFIVNFYNKNTYIEYETNHADFIGQAFYNHIYYFVLSGVVYKNTKEKDVGYYFIRFDSVNNEFKMSELNVTDRVIEFNQFEDQIYVKFENNGSINECRYYIK